MKRTVRFSVFVAVGIAIAASLAFFVSPQASSAPDGLNRVAIDKGFDTHEKPQALRDVPTAGYAVRGVDDDRLSTGLAGLIGVAATFTVACGLLVIVRKVGGSRAAPEQA